MNIKTQVLPTSVKEGFLAMHPQDIKDFFRSMRDNECEVLGSLTQEGLTALQERVKLLKELEHYVSTLPETTKPKSK